MSTYFKKGKGWRYDFTQQGTRHTEAWFKTKKEAKEAEAKKREELKNPPATVETPTDMAFLDLLNLRLDYVQAYKCKSYYLEHIYLAKKLLKNWQDLNCGDITTQMVQAYLIHRGKDSAFAANRDLRYLRAIFNFGVKQGLIIANPTKGLEFMPVERKLRYVPSKEDVARVLLAADPDSQDYLVAIMDTMGRVSEINRLTWEDVDLEARYVVLYTRKKKGGHLTPRKVSMTTRLHSMLAKRYKNRDKTKPWVFWGRHWSRKAGGFVEGPYQDRKGLMRILCRKAGVKYFRYHALRHFGASVLERANVPIGSIQRILGHENRTTTEIYLHSISEAEREAMAVFERACQDTPLEEIHTQIHTR
ncbi:MAG: tyrosine-type recombinase/integrase [Desulfobaccales bacterium]